MRLLQLALSPDEILDLHPNVSVVTALGDEQRAHLVEVILGLARLEAPAGTGMLEAHGVMFDLDQELLDAIGDCAEVDPVVHPGQLPAQPMTVEARRLRSREQDLSLLREAIDGHAHASAQADEALGAATEVVEGARRALEDGTALAESSQADVLQLEQRRADLVGERPRLDEELQAARSKAPSVEAATAASSGEVERARVSAEECAALRASVEAELTAQAALDNGEAEADVERARAALQSVEADVAAEREADAAQAALDAAKAARETEQEPATDRLDRLDARITDVERLISVITPVERHDVEQARAGLVDRSDGGMVASPEAVALAARLDRVEADLAALGSDVPADADPGAAVASRSRLDDARQGLLEAERAMRTPVLDPNDVARLEAVHADITEVADRPVGRFGSGRSDPARLDELRAEQEELLTRLGYASYPAYVMGYSLHQADPALEAAVEAAQAELASAEAEWHELERSTELVLARAALLDERRVLLEEARLLLDRATAQMSPQQALRDLRIPGETAAEATAALRTSLEAVGLVLGDEELDHHDLLELADAWLGESDRVDGRRQEALAELASLQSQRPDLAQEAEAELAAAEEPSSISVEESTAAAEDLRLERVARARGALAAAERRLADARAHAEHRGTLEADLASARELEQAARDELDDAEARLRTDVAEQQRLTERVAALVEELDHVDHEIEEIDSTLEALSGDAPDLERLRADLTHAEAAHAAALAMADDARRTLDEERERAAAMAEEVERLREAAGATMATEATPAEELEWYLLARLASQRAVSIAGSCPVLLDDALRGVEAPDVPAILERLERIAQAVQVIILSEDPVVLGWAASAGFERAAVVGVSAA